MKMTKRIIRPVSMFLVLSVAWLTFPCGYAAAAIVGTEAVVRSVRAEQARSYINSVLERREIRDALEKYGIDAAEARSRADSLTDAEAIRLAHEIEKAPAGGDAIVTILIVGAVVFLILLFTDIAGYTDIFPFVQK